MSLTARNRRLSHVQRGVGGRWRILVLTRRSIVFSFAFSTSFDYHHPHSAEVPLCLWTLSAHRCPAHGASAHKPGLLAAMHTENPALPF